LSKTCVLTPAPAPLPPPVRFDCFLQETPQWQEYLLGLGPLSVKDTPKERDAKLAKIKQALVQAFADMDDELWSNEGMDGSGSTLVLAVVAPTHIVCASVGDSRCVVGSMGKSEFGTRWGGVSFLG